MITEAQLTRRALLKGSGGLVITFSLAAALRRSGALAQTPPEATPRDTSGDTVDSWLAIGTDGNVTVYAGKVELGTGIKTAFTQIVAEELSVPFERVTMILGDTMQTPDQGTTAGSKSIQNGGPEVRQAAAEARLILLTRASAQLSVPVDDLEVTDGVISAVSDPTKTVPYGDLVVEPFETEITGEAPLKAPADYTIVGQSIHRLDIPAKLTGGVAFVQDLRLEGMLHGRVLRPYLRTMDGVGATIESVDDSAAATMPGVVQIVRSGNFIGVVAEREEEAIRAAEALTVTWTAPEPLPEQSQLYEYILQAPVQDDAEVVRNGDIDGALGVAAKTLEATYEFPFQAHASMGPSCSVADVRADGATIWSSSQGIYALRNAIAPILGMEREQIRVIHMEGAGCYGHNGADDVSADAAVLSQAVGRPVRVQWMRHDEFAWEPKGPAMVSKLRGGLDAEGNIIAWDYEVWTPTHTTRPGGQPANLLAGQLVDPPAEPAEHGTTGGDRNAPHNYSFPNNRVTAHWLERSLLRPSALRSLGGMANTTANEGFLDELAAAAGADPVEFRLRHLYDPRAIDAIRKVAEASGWQTRPSGPAARGETVTADAGPLTGRGIAFARYEAEYTYAAVVAEVEVDPTTGEVRVTRVVVAHDAGLIINPDGLTNQIEGNVIQGVSRALHEEITFDQTGLTSLDWSTYHILTFPEVPTIEVALIDRPEEPALGAGEPAICPMAAAVANAIFDATGARLRTVPYTAERVLTAMDL